MRGSTAPTPVVVSFIAVILVAMTIACGGNATSSGPFRGTNSTPTPAPGPTPTPTPTPMPSPSSTQYQVTLFSGTTSHGQVTVDTGGTVTVQVVGATASTTYGVEFCPFPTTRYQCFPVGGVTTDATGAVQTTMHFPKPGTWAGDFDLTLNGVAFSTQVASNIGQVFFATLEPASVANGQGTGTTPSTSATSQDRGAGTLTVSGGTVHVVLTGAAASTLYAVVQCFPSDGSGCFQLGPFNNNSFMTDASGNATFDVPALDIPGDFFRVEQAIATPSTPMGFAAGFKVP